MKSREVRKLLFDVERACNRILRFTQASTLDAFLGDELLQSAIERQSEIIGEALRQAAGLDPSLPERIPDIRRIVAFRNRLIHGYAEVSPQIVWGIATDDVPRLLADVRAITGEDPSHPA
jgi:uncharacterized protein with HEPN domain